MTPAPLPPHERSWRHPSELSAPEHEPPTRGGRLLVASTAAVGLVLVGALAVRMTPGRTSPGEALATVSASSVFGNANATSMGGLAGAANEAGRGVIGTFRRTLSSLVSAANRTPVSATTLSPAAVTRTDDPTVAIVTPIGSDGLGVTTEAAIAGHSGAIDAMLPSGTVVTAELIGVDSGIAVVRLSAEAEIDGASFVRKPADELTVVALGNELTVSSDDLLTLSVPEASPVFDSSGELVGLLTIGPDGVAMLPVDSLPGVEPPVVAASETSATAATTEPEDTSVTASEPVQSPGSSSPASSGEPPASDVPGSTDGSGTPASSPPSSDAVSASVVVTAHSQPRP